MVRPTGGKPIVKNPPSQESTDCCLIMINFSVDNSIFYKVEYVSAMALKILTAAGLDEAAAAVLSSDTNVGMSTTVVLLVN